MKRITGSFGVSGPQPGVRRKRVTVTGFPRPLCCASRPSQGRTRLTPPMAAGAEAAAFMAEASAASIAAGLVASTPADLVGSPDFTGADFPAVALTQMLEWADFVPRGFAVGQTPAAWSCG